MIISYKHKLIFIHCRKTAGSSISMMLAKSLGPCDIQLSALSETLKHGGRVPTRTWVSAIAQSGVQMPHLILRPDGWEEIFSSCAKRAYRRLLGIKPQHANAALVASAFPREWESFTKFCVVRNPFTLAVSDYNWRTRHSNVRPSFIEYLRALASSDSLGGVAPVGFHNNWRQYTIEGRVAVDQVVRFESLIEDLGRILSTVGIPFNGELPKLKDLKAKAEKSRPYREYYTPEAVDLVAELYREEIDAFGYTIEDIH